MTRYILLVPAAICALLLVGAGAVSAYTGEQLAKYAKVTLAEARVVALKAFPYSDRQTIRIFEASGSESLPRERPGDGWTGTRTENQSRKLISVPELFMAKRNGPAQQGEARLGYE